MPTVRSISAAEAEQPEVRRGGPSPQAYVRFQRRKTSHGREATEMQIGRAVWYEVGRPERVALEWHGDEIRIVPDESEGWKLRSGYYTVPRCWLPSDIEIEPGRYAATVRNGVIVVGNKERD